jgi:hypothetical protein
VSTRGISLEAGNAYQLTVGGSLVWVEEVKPYPTGPLGVILPDQLDPEAYAMGIPGSTRCKGLGCFASGTKIPFSELSDYNQKFVTDLPRLRRAGTATVPPPRVTNKSRATRSTARPGRSLVDVAKRYAFLKNNPAFKPGTQSGLVQSTLLSLCKPTTTKQEITDALLKDPAWKWGDTAARKAARWYVDVLVREGFAKEI